MREPCKTVCVSAEPPEEHIAMWRPAAGVVCIRGTTNRYAVTPNGETIVGMVTAGAMLAQRVRRSRCLLEAGLPISEVALRAGFSDQSHLHRHVRRTLGMTPARYVRALRSDVQDELASPS
jgi:helix-turn-helix protein